MSSETPYDLPNGERIPVIDPDTAAHNLRLLLDRFRTGRLEPLFFGDNGAPEGVVLPFAAWQQLEALAEDAAQTEHSRAVARERLAGASPDEYVPVDDLAAELGWNLDSDDHPPKSTDTPR
ncbi:hypothetical protein Kfla_4638 [Kribbella flavida DSM 17836]|uniref:Prevent-host-death family protein n=1 Tax=Kribbella flavida (strain DSM 17836 / JCM 10339 / NBRC 14399) TaxID=479435 RepID=D2PY50_KRIFD|nr:hypothetical protein [Kribbella flavida]ADB33656.1 hypothetical protein Kfla_4638 [Kribbella flavida DSM 17836]